MVKDLTYPEGATPLDPDEAEGLIPDHIGTQEQLNEWEQANIVKGWNWAKKKKPTIQEILTEGFVRELHKRMLGDTWKWAGTFRKSDKNIGIEWTKVGPQLTVLLGNLLYQAEHRTLPPDRLAIELHHKLVFIHPFPNGNGRHSRMMADLLLLALGQPPFGWGNSGLVSDDQMRQDYLTALRRADQGDYQALLDFARRQ